MTTTIRTNTRDFFVQIMVVLGGIPPFEELSPREKELLGHLLYYNYKYRSIDEDLRCKLIFDYDTRLDIRSKMGISEFNFNNLKTSLTSKGLISGKKILLHKSIMNITPENPKIIYNFIVND